MPSRPLRPCPRCRTPFAGRRCPTCSARWLATKAMRAAADPTPSPYSDRGWREFSAAFLRQHPLCECPPEIRGHADAPDWRRPASQVVDHIDGTGVAGPRGYDLTNLQAMSRSCHAVKTNKFDGGWGNRVRRADVDLTVIGPHRRR